MNNKLDLTQYSSCRIVNLGLGVAQVRIKILTHSV
jgi:hypothetical protein